MNEESQGPDTPIGRGVREDLGAPLPGETQQLLAQDAQQIGEQLARAQGIDQRYRRQDIRIYGTKQRRRR